MNKRHELEHLLQYIDKDKNYFLNNMEWDADIAAYREYPLGMFQSPYITLRYPDRRCRPWTVEIPALIEFMKDKPLYSALCIIPLFILIFFMYIKRRNGNKVLKESVKAK